MSFIELCYEYPLRLSMPPGEDYFTMPLEVASEMGLKPEVFTLRNKEQTRNDILGNILIQRFKNPISLLGKIARKKARLMHGHTLGWIPSTLAPLIKNNYILTAHTCQAKKDLRYRIATCAASRADKILVSTDFTKKSFSPFMDESKIEVFPLPINYGLWRKCTGGDEFRVKNNVNEGLIVTVATIRPEKNFTTLIKAFNIVNQTLPKTKLVIVGSDPFESVPSLKRLALDVGVEHNVIFYNRANSDEVMEILAAADVFVMPSIYESQCIAVYEAAAAGLPLVLSNLGVFETFSDCAFFQEPLDHETLGKNLLVLLSDQNLAKSNGRKAQEKMKQFDTSILKLQLKRIYEKSLIDRI